MNENAKKWVSALRSGEYEQTRYALRDGKGFCCLGVACDLYAKEYPEAGWAEEEDGVQSDTEDSPDFIFEVLGQEPSITMLPHRVKAWLGLSDISGSLFLCDRAEKLMDMNDEGATFAQIADVIEYEPEGLFIKDA